MDNNENIEVLDETLAADSIKPKGDASKVQVMAAAVKAIAGMNPENLKNFMATISAPNLGAPIDGGAAAKNAATIAMKPSAASSMKEDLTAVFEGEDLTEEFKDRASALFEAAIEVRVMTEMARLEEEYAEALEEQMGTFTEELTTKLDSYLDYVVENWMEENQVAIESTIHSELTQDFIEGLRNLFAEHYINVPNDKVDVLEALAEKVSILESKLDEVLVENNELRGALVEEAAKDVIEEVSSGLALTQKDKFVKIAEGIEFDGDLETFEKKLTAIKESYFGKGQTNQSNILEESYEGEEETTAKYIDPNVGRYVDAIAKNIKK
jgi:AcrR family transcriptional regulator